MIDFKAPTFYSKDIREMASLMANTNVFVGADSGIMHLASAAQVPVVGLFSVTNMEKYKPYNSNSIGLNTDDSNNETIYKAIELTKKAGLKYLYQGNPLPFIFTDSKAFMPSSNSVIFSSLKQSSIILATKTGTPSSLAPGVSVLGIMVSVWGICRFNYNIRIR